MTAATNTLDAQLRRASARLREVREAGDEELMAFWAVELDRLLEAKLEEGLP